MSSSLLTKNRSSVVPASLHPLTEKNFGLFWLGAFLSSTGFWIQAVGQGWHVLLLTNSALLLGVVTFAAFLPNVIFSLFGGFIADRFERRHILLVTQCIFLLISLSLGLLTTFGLINVWHIMCLVILSGTVSAISTPAWLSFIGELVPPQELKQGIALNAMQFNLSRVIGPAIGGISIGLVGIAGSYYLNALSYVAVIIPLLVMKPRMQRRIGAKQDVWKGLRAGYTYARSHALLPLLFLLQFTVAFLVFPFAALLPIFADHVYNVGATGLGVLNAVTGIGALIGSILIMTFNQRIQNYQRILIILCLVGGFASLIFGLLPAFEPALFILLILGACSVMPNILTNTALQSMVPEEMRGRVLSIWIGIAFGLAPCGNLVSGWVAQSIGAPLTIVINGTLCIVTTLMIVLARKYYNERTMALPVTSR